MNIEFDKEYLQDLFFKGKTSDKRHAFSQKSYEAIKRRLSHLPMQSA